MFVGFYFILNAFFSLGGIAFNALWVSLFVLLILSLGSTYSNPFGLLSHSTLMVPEYLLARAPLRNLFFVEVLFFWGVDIGPSILSLPFLFLFFQVPFSSWILLMIFFLLATLVLIFVSHILFSLLRNLPLYLTFIVVLPFYLPFFLFCLDGSLNILEGDNVQFHALSLGGFWICLCVLGPYIQEFFYRVRL